MIVWTCSYRDVWSFYRTDVIVRWFLGECKSEIHRRAKKFSANIKPVFNEFSKELKRKLSKFADYLPSSALFGKVRKLWAVDSFLIEVPFGKRNKETLWKKFQLSLKQGKYKEAAKLFTNTYSARLGEGSRESSPRRGIEVTLTSRSSFSCYPQC